jgi:hypothetical protein
MNKKPQFYIFYLNHGQAGLQKAGFNGKTTLAHLLIYQNGAAQEDFQILFQYIRLFGFSAPDVRAAAPVCLVLFTASRKGREPDL